MTLRRLHPLPVAIFGVLALSSAALVGCTPEAEPTPTPTPAFASKEEAFAAAEETYRAYTDALNAVVPADPATFEAVFAFSRGDFQKSDRENLSIMHAEQLTITGENRVVGFRGLSTTPSRDSVVAQICIDVSTLAITDPDGVSRVDPNRPDLSVIDATFVADKGVLLIDSAVRSEDEQCR